MWILFVCFVAFACSLGALIVKLSPKPLASVGKRQGAIYATASATTNGTTSAAGKAARAARKAADAAAKTREFATLLALTNELDSTNFCLRNSLFETASLFAEWLDFDSLAQVESMLGTTLVGGPAVNSSDLNAAACQLERNLAACQTVCALIEPGPIEAFDQSRRDDSFVSLLTRAEKRLSIIAGRMRQERRIVNDAKNDLASAQRWMETASLVLRAIPLKTRFTSLTQSR